MNPALDCTRLHRQQRPANAISTTRLDKRLLATIPARHCGVDRAQERPDRAWRARPTVSRWSSTRSTPPRSTRHPKNGARFVATLGYGGGRCRDRRRRTARAPEALRSPARGAFAALRPAHPTSAAGRSSATAACGRSWRRWLAHSTVSNQCAFLGHRDDIIDLHHAFDLFVQSSDYEGTPNAVLEAMAMETPDCRNRCRRHARTGAARRTRPDRAPPRCSGA